MYIVYRSISTIELQAQIYSFPRYRSRDSDRKRSRRVMLQGILYSLALILTYTFTLIESLNNGASYVLHILMYTFWPLQGFFNALIYSIPAFQRMYKRWIEKMEDRQEAEDGNSKSLPSSSFKSKKKSSNSNNSGRSTIHDNQHDQSVLMIDEIEEEEWGRKESNEGKAEEEDIQKGSNEPTYIHLGPICDQSRMKKNVECNVIDNIESSSDDCRGSDVCEREETTEETQESIEYYVSTHHVDGYNDDDDDDYLALALMSN
jgi:hypothetical protein